MLIKVTTHCTIKQESQVNHINDNIISQLGNFKSTHSKVTEFRLQTFLRCMAK